jgi:hypothetical protein
MRLLENISLMGPYSFLVAVIPLWIACVCLCVCSFLIVRHLHRLSRSLASIRSNNERQFLEELRKRSHHDEAQASKGD